MKSLVCLVSLVLCAVVRADDTPSFKILPPSNETAGQFGEDVAVSGDTAVVGAYLASGGNGRVYVHRWDGAAWNLEATLAPANGTANNHFGLSVEIDRDTVVVGANQDDSAASTAGAVYVFRRTGTTWVQEAKLVATDAAAGDQFGYDVAIDGDTIVATAPCDNIGANADQGSAYVFTRSGSVWTQRAKLVASDGAANDLFGLGSVALHGDTIVVGASADQVGANTSQGSAYVFVSTAGQSWTTWTQQQQLFATGGATNDLFGKTVAIEGNTIAVGASGRDGPGGANQGAAFVFTRSGTLWTQQQELLAPDAGGSDSATYYRSLSLSGDTIAMGRYGNLSFRGAVSIFRRSGSTWTHEATLRAADGTNSDFFGYSLDLNANTLIVGALHDNDGQRVNYSGSAYIYFRVGDKWVEGYQRLTPFTPGINEQLGTSVAISGNTAIVGSPLKDVGATADQGTAPVYVRNGNLWNLTSTLTASDGAANDNFGRSVAIDGDTAVVGAYLDDVGANADQGSLYVFTRSGTVWTQRAQLVAADGAAGDRLGTSVAISGNTIIAGAWFDDVGANADQGSVYVFTGSGDSWSQQARLTASDGAASDFFGYSLALQGNTALIGAFGDDVGPNTDQGSAYVYTRSGTTWTQQQRLNASNGIGLDRFGYSVALDGDTALFGAYWDDVGSNVDQGSAYVFTRAGNTWTQQAQLIADDGAAINRFGASVAIEGNTAFVGAPVTSVDADLNQGVGYFFVRSGSEWFFKDKTNPLPIAANDGFGNAAAMDGGTAVVGASLTDLGAATNTGAAYFFDYADWAYSLVRNTTLPQNYASLAGAVSSSSSGQSLLCSAGAFWLRENVDTLSRQLFISSQTGIARPFQSVTTLGNNSTLSAAPGYAIELHGLFQTTVSGSCELYGDDLRTSGGAELNCRGPSSRISVYADEIELRGQTRLDSASTLSLANGATFFGPLVMLDNSSLLSFGPLDLDSQTSVYTGTISSPSVNIGIQAQFSGVQPLLVADVTNSGSVYLVGTTYIFGDFRNNAGATVVVNQGNAYVLGTITNNGTLDTDVCCRSTIGISIDRDYLAGPSSGVALGEGTLAIGGNADLGMTTNTNWKMSRSELKMTGLHGPSTLEAISRDFGASFEGLDAWRKGAMPVETLTIGQGAVVTLIDNRDNDESGSDAEAIYCSSLVVQSGSLLNTDGPCRIYCTTITNQGHVTDASKIVLLNPCQADFDHDGFLNGADFDDFVEAFEKGDLAADFDQDGFLNGVDFDLFVYAYEEGC